MKLAVTCAAVAAVAAAGCAVNPPLLFADNTTVGIGLGNDSASAGASVSLGYKARSLAVVPVSVLKADGQAAALLGRDKDNADALSVFAVFETTANAPATAASAGRVRLGQVFATGLAAQALAKGYECRYRGGDSCTPPAAVNQAASAAEQTQARQDADRPYQHPLVYARTDVFGLEIGGAVAEQGTHFTLGFGSRNLALVPVVARSANGHVSRLFGNDSSGQRDAYSVLGQFRSDTATRGLGIGLERFFATGVAAETLGQGLMYAVGGEPRQPASAQAAASAPPVGAAVARAGQ